MSRPGPKINNDPERLNHLEKMVRYIFQRDPDETTTHLLRQLDELQDRHGCSVCHKSYSDAKGLRRHILSTIDERHTALATKLHSLACGKCGQEFTKREQVTKHENRCARGPISAQTSRGWTTESEGESEPPLQDQNLARLPPIFSNAASPYGRYFTTSDGVME